MKTGALIGKLSMVGFVSAAIATGSPPARANDITPLDSSKGKIMCSYLSYGVRNYVCGKPPLEKVKKRCEEKGTKEHGEKVTCACTDDPDFIRDTCD